MCWIWARGGPFPDRCCGSESELYVALCEGRFLGVYLLGANVDLLMLTGVVTVYGVDLFPPPHQWVPPNCVLEANDIQKPRAWQDKLDLIHRSQCFHPPSLYVSSLLMGVRTHAWILQQRALAEPLPYSIQKLCTMRLDRASRE